jgi:flagellar assembly factor FliW
MQTTTDTIRINTVRFGTLDVNKNQVIHFPKGILGFPNERAFVLIEKAEGAQAGYLVSASTPWLAFPVMDAALLAPFYPNPSAQIIAKNAGLACDDVAMLLVMSRQNGSAQLSVNMLAPLVIDMTTRSGAQVMLDSTRYSSQLSLQAQNTNANDNARFASASR